MSLESLLDDARIGCGGGRIQIDQFGEKWRVVVAHFNGPQVMIEDVTPSAALRAALVEDERQGRVPAPAVERDPAQLEMLADDDFGDLGL